MATRQVMRHCNNCARQTLHVQQYMSAATHIVLLLITGGLWVLALIAYYVLGGWLIEPVRKAMEKGKCTACGSAPAAQPMLATGHLSTGVSSPSPVDPTAKLIIVGFGVLLFGVLGAIAYLASPTATSAIEVEATPMERSVFNPETSATQVQDDEWTTLTGVSSGAQVGFVCQAVVAALMGHPIEIMHVERVRDNEADVRYNRPSDGMLWRTRCKMENGSVVWRTIDAFGPGSGLGRWRNGPDDSRISVAIARRRDALRVTEEYSDGSRSVHEIDLAF
ncbi:hypothetical protein [Terricaulis silvestris]|uniref:Uncharacterized protein n=1 Tax=Terricaulis silvestris TaxID=2686094 RepID=A0A6I6MT42_9CAUL|nr:hypothetical protein [Terricaulis silvestris]QGZ96518.1 hypothetical protein DSM104635_03378 [Terricaulis silvestris]